MSNNNKLTQAQLHEELQEIFKSSAKCQIEQLLKGTNKTYGFCEKRACRILGKREGLFDKDTLRNILLKSENDDYIVKSIKCIITSKDRNFPIDICIYVVLLKAMLEVEKEAVEKGTPINFTEESIWSAWFIVMDQYNVMNEIKKYNGSWAYAIGNIENNNDTEWCIIL